MSTPANSDRETSPRLLDLQRVGWPLLLVAVGLLGVAGALLASLLLHFVSESKAIGLQPASALRAAVLLVGFAAGVLALAGKYLAWRHWGGRGRLAVGTSALVGGLALAFGCLAAVGLVVMGEGQENVRALFAIGWMGLSSALISEAAMLGFLYDVASTARSKQARSAVMGLLGSCLFALAVLALPAYRAVALAGAPATVENAREARDIALAAQMVGMLAALGYGAVVLGVREELAGADQSEATGAGPELDEKAEGGPELDGAGE